MADMISTLPDQVLCHILSFLPTHDAATTSLVSKKWKTLWLSVPSLYFDDERYLTNNNKPYDCFSKFIHRTILTRDIHLPITSFRIHCGVSASNIKLSDSDLRIWVNAVIQRGLENLHMHLSYNSMQLLKSCIFTCKTLVVLKLIALDVDQFSSVNLPSLKTLHLDEVGFQEPRYLMELLSGCPNLEDMHVSEMSYIHNSNPSLKNFKSLSKLVRADMFGIYFNFPLKAVCNVEFLRIDEYPGDIPVFRNLTHLELMLGSDMQWHFLLAMLKHCPKLQNLGLDLNPCFTTDGVWISPYIVPECLSSHLRTCSITNYEGLKCELDFAKYILQSSRVLRRMTICTSVLRVDKLGLLKELSLCRRSSPVCEVSFE